eukprot:2759504-Rhodomonas_salina.2
MEGTWWYRTLAQYRIARRGVLGWYLVHSHRSTNLPKKRSIPSLPCASGYGLSPAVVTKYPLSFNSDPRACSSIPGCQNTRMRYGVPGQASSVVAHERCYNE